MDFSNSVTNYCKFNKSVEEKPSLRGCTRDRKLIIAVLAGIVFVATVVAICVGILSHNRNNTKSTPNSAAITPSSVLGSICNVTRFQNSCVASISQFGAEANTTDPKILFNLTLIAAINELSKLQSFATKLISVANSTDEDLKSALEVCEEVLDNASYRLNDSISSNLSSMDDLKSWLSATLTDQETCLDALREMESSESHLNTIEDVKTAMQIPSEFASNSLAIVARFLSVAKNYGVDFNRRKLLGISTDTEFPSWVSLRDRRLIEHPSTNLTVAKDGSGDFETIAEAVAKIPKKSTDRFVIYVKEGVYDGEHVEVKKSMWNLMIYGDGKDKTIISGHIHAVPNKTKTFQTASFAVSGRGFIGKDIKFINTAGPQNAQAVAFRSDSDKSVCYKCAFEAFQDTLYLHSGRQFYRDCDIVGTVDFIFGNAAAVLQDCRIVPREPRKGQAITITAQGKNESNQHTGFSIQNCSIFPLDGNVTARTYLGRPWKDFSTTVVIRSDIHSFLDPSGWSQWNSSLPPRTIYYGEFENVGEGSGIDRRVNWTGYKPALATGEAEKFSVKSFLKGEEWLPAISVPFDLNI